MKSEEFSDLCVAEIMHRWPATIGVFIDLQMHCVGCPIGIFHTLSDAADEHGLPLEHLVAEISAAIEQSAGASPERACRPPRRGGMKPPRETFTDAPLRNLLLSRR